MQLMPSQETLRGLANLVLAGFGVALFAWIFDIVRKSFFAGMGKAFKASFHGSISYMLAVTEIQIARTEKAIERPTIAIARLILGVFVVLGGLMVTMLALMTSFIGTYYPPKGVFLPIMTGPANIRLPVLILCAVQIAVGMIITNEQLILLIQPEKELEKLRKQKLALEARALVRNEK